MGEVVAEPICRRPITVHVFRASAAYEMGAGILRRRDRTGLRCRHPIYKKWNRPLAGIDGSV